jgi:hypothetical protein
VRPYKKSNPIQMGFIEDIVLIITKGYMIFVYCGEPLLEANGVVPL